jgi:hypothetical protein
VTTIVNGFYKHGQIQLLQVPCGLPEGGVRIILIAEERPNLPACHLTFGKYSTGRMSTLEDFSSSG